MAQSNDQSGSSDKPDQDIIVTGTLIRGIAPTGSNVIGIDRQQIEATGSTSTNELLGSIPQAGGFFFNNIPQVANGSAGQNTRIAVNRINLRNLPGANTSGGAPTLVLVDGHRVVGAGLGQIAVDSDLVLPAVIERVDTMADGASAIYGSDAVGGVINFVTRDRYDGVKVDARAGFADNYKQYDANITAGKDWGSGSAWISYGYRNTNALFGRDRDYVRA
jgi:iron complex outermembrane receptor protein